MAALRRARLSHCYRRQAGAKRRLTGERSDPGVEPQTATAKANQQAASQPAAAGRVASRRFHIGPVDLLAGALWLAIALGVVVVATRALPFGGGKRHHSASQSAAQPATATFAPATAATTAAVAVASATSAAATGTATPVPPLLTGAAPDSALLRPGAALIERIDLPPAGSGPTSVVYSSAAGIDGCAHPYVDVLRASAGGSWKPVWTATSSPVDGGPLIPAVNRSDAGCFPRVSLVAVRGLDRGQPGLALSIVAANGAQHVVVVDLAGTPSPAVVASLDFAPGLTLDAADASPLVLEATEPVPTPAAAGDGAWAGQTVAQLSQRFVWRGGSFSGAGWVATPTCLDGTVAARTEDAAPVLVVRCADTDRYAAVQLPAETVIPEGLRPADLQDGDDVQIALAQPPAGAAPQALPVAARVYSSAAQNRALLAAAATASPTVTPPVATAAPRTPAPTRASTAPPTTIPTAAAPPPVAATSVVSPAVVAPVETPPPVVTRAPPTRAPAATTPPTIVPARTVPPQPTPPVPVRTVPPQPR